MSKIGIIVAVLLILISCSEKQENHNNKPIKKECYYSHIDSIDYAHVMISCDAPVAYNALLNSIECLDKKYNMEYFRTNYRSNKGSMDDRNKIIHFVAFGYFHDTIMKNELEQYILDNDTASRISIKYNNRFPFYYAKKTYDEMNNIMEDTMHYAKFTKEERKNILKRSRLQLQNK